MTTFIVCCLFLMLSGLKNAFYYRYAAVNGLSNTTGIIVAIYAMAITLIAWVIAFNELNPYNGLILFIPMVPVLLMYVLVMLPGRTDKIHWWENLVRAVMFFTGFIAGADIYQLILALAFTGNMIFNQIVYYASAINHGIPKRRAILAYWNTSREERRRFAKGNWFSFVMLPGWLEIILGTAAAILCIYLWRRGLYWNVIKYPL